MQGDDGREYVFLLKGHEDLRQDERVMQLFGQASVTPHWIGSRMHSVYIHFVVIVPLPTVGTAQ